MAFALVACGDGGGTSGGSSSSSDSSSSSSSSSSSGGPLSTNFLNVEVQAGGSARRPKKLKLAWEVDAEPEYYRIEINPDGASGFSRSGLGVIAGDVTEFEFAVPLHLVKWKNAQLQLVALNATESELGRSEIVPLDQVTIEKMIGYFKAPVIEPELAFGMASALSSDGQTLAVSALGLDRDGAVYTYVKNTGEWHFQEKLIPEELDNLDRFGDRSLALSADGNTLAIGAIGEDSDATGIDGDASVNVDTNFNTGAAYIFARDNKGNWAQQSYIKAFNTGERYFFGASVALSADGRRLAVGAAGESNDSTSSDNEVSNSGAIHVFDYSDSGWTQTAYITGTDMAEGRRLGASIALSAEGDILAAGADSWGPGRIYVFAFDDDTGEWRQQMVAKESEGDSSDGLGFSIALSDDGNTLVAGAPFHSAAGENTGAVFVYQRDGESWAPPVRLLASNPDPDDHFGLVSLSGDGNTLAVGAPQEGSASTGLNSDASNNNAEISGAVYIYQRETEWLQKLYLKAPNTEVQEGFGFSVTLSFDGKSLFASAPLEDSVATGIGGDWDNNNGTNAGAVFLY
ncbi:FG-GAP repeat protein [Microbulbifer litoralis]|uniref:FG-GAP repeat protein n=1 Tax=Microbulbifer litoralis TaxID=2933965 RepID=UPI0020286FD9|nr:FG-GAP repeat protein [Microbulbifer sp. GX H0434]